MTTVNTPVVALPNANPSGLVASYVNGTSVNVTAGTCWDNTNTFNMTLSANTVLNAAVNGINGLDKGSLANNQFYYIYIIGSSLNRKPTGVILSLSNSLPIMPVSYDLLKIIGYVFTNGSAAITSFYITGTGSARRNYWDATNPVLINGAATTLTNIDMTGTIPSFDNISVLLQVSYSNVTPGARVTIAAGGSTNATVQPFLACSVTSVIVSGQFWAVSRLISGTPRIQYINSAANGITNINVAAFEFTI